MYESLRSFEVNLAVEDAGAAQDRLAAPRRPTRADVVFSADRLNESGTILAESDLVALRDYLANGITTTIGEIFAPPLTEERIARHIFGWCMAHLPPHLAHRLALVRVSRGPDTTATYREGTS